MTGACGESRRVYVYDVTGVLLGEYSVLVDGQGKLYPKLEKLRVWFAGRPLEWEDRLGSKVVGPIDQQTGQSTRYRYYPYGQNIGTNVGWDDVQFATYTRDRATGLDYARNRYYTRTWGRFLSPDPYVASGGPADPGSWNRYAYVQGDPVNFNDPGGLAACTVSHNLFGYAYVSCTSKSGKHSLSQVVISTAPDGQNYGYSIDHVKKGLSESVDGMEAKELFDNAIADAKHRLLTKCPDLFPQAKSAPWGGSGAAMLELYEREGFISYGTTYVANGGAGLLEFSGPNVGGVTTYANASHMGVSTNRISLNYKGFGFTGQIIQDGKWVDVRRAQPSAYSGLNQVEILSLIIIHELGHAAGAIPSDAGSVGASMKNSEVIRNKCF